MSTRDCTKNSHVCIWMSRDCILGYCHILHRFRMLASGVPNCEVELQASCCSGHRSWQVENLLLIAQDKECLFNSVILVRGPSSLCLPSWHNSCDKCRRGLPPRCLHVISNQKLWWACSQDDLIKSTFSTLDTNWLSLKTKNILGILNLLTGWTMPISRRIHSESIS